jgi:hypothetical protein
MILLPQKVAYRGTISGLRISSVDGTAFMDNCAALVPYADGSHLVEIYDASGRMLRGYLGAPGTGETLGVSVLAGLNFSSGWIVSPGSIIDADSYSTTATGGVQSIADLLVALTLYKGALVGATSAGTVTIRDALGGTGYALFASDLIGTPGYSTARVKTSNELRIYIRNSQAATTDVTAAGTYVTPVLTPSTDGCTIVSAKGGTTENFAYKDASFTYNAASYYCLIKRAR